MTKKWLSQTPYPSQIPEFYTLTKIHKPTLVGRPIISGCNGPTERISALILLTHYLGLFLHNKRLILKTPQILLTSLKKFY